MLTKKLEVSIVLHERIEMYVYSVFIHLYSGERDKIHNPIDLAQIYYPQDLWQHR